MHGFSTFKVLPTANGRKFVKLYPSQHNSHVWAYMEYILCDTGWEPDCEEAASLYQHKDAGMLDTTVHRDPFDGHDTEYLVWYFKREHGHG